MIWLNIILDETYQSKDEIELKLNLLLKECISEVNNLPRLPQIFENSRKKINQLANSVLSLDSLLDAFSIF